MPRVVLENVSKSFAAPGGKSVGAVNNVSLAVADKELLALVGPSGCGKTTLLRLIAGLESVEQGGIHFDGQAVTKWPPQKRNVAMVFQSHALFPHLTGFENIALGLKLRGVARKEIAERVHATAEMLGVIHCLQRPPAELSGGERQRMALGRALVRRPHILLLDEPFSNLDPPLRAQMRTELRNLHAGLATTMIYVTHDQAEALALGDRVAVMNAGRLQQVGPPRELYQAPANRFVAGFVGSPAMNLFYGTIGQRDGYLVFIGTAATPTGATSGFILQLKGERREAFGRHQGQRVLLGFRPEHLAVVDVAPPPPPHPTITALLKAVEFAGQEMILQLTVGDEVVQVRADAKLALTTGQSVSVAFDLRQARVFDADTGDLLF
jgi:multiple sugar transport system ATP-binding protein